MSDDDERWEGRGANLVAAFEDAWHQAERSGKSGRFTVETIAFEASNPIHTYIIVISCDNG
jgi:hypothetical protein